VFAGLTALVATTVALAALSAPAAAAPHDWQRPVPGRVTRVFDYAGDPFAAGRHRGVDFAVRPGQAVRAACAGQVVFAGTAGSSGPTVSVRCGSWRVAYLPLRVIAVGRGARVGRGTRLGTAAGGGRHAGLHVGVRRDGRRWAYVDPLPFFGAVAPPALPIGPPPRVLRRPPLGAPVRIPSAPRSAPRAVPVPAPGAPAAVPRAGPLPRAPAPVAARRARPLPRAVARSPLAPWPAWAGLALVLAGACGAGVSRRRRRAARPRGSTEPVAARGASA
jgi:hypothetical protein